MCLQRVCATKKSIQALAAPAVSKPNLNVEYFMYTFIHGIDDSVRI